MKGTILILITGAIVVLVGITAWVVYTKGKTKTERGSGQVSEMVAPGVTQKTSAESPWIMHRMDTRFAYWNALVPVDADGDGWIDFGTMHENELMPCYSILFNPGDAQDGAALRDEWKKVYITTAAQGGLENMFMDDVDGDGHVDIIGSEGNEANKPDRHGGIRVVFGPGHKEARDSTKWKDGGLFPATFDAGLFVWTETRDINLDVNGDGRLDLLGAIFQDEKGHTPSDVWSVFWLEWTGAKPTANDWIAHPIKRAYGTAYKEFWFGEKYDFVRFADVDRDGDLDIVANIEELRTPKSTKTKSILGVVWFDTEGNEIFCQGGSLCKFGDTFYFYGWADYPGDNRYDKIT